MLDIRFRLDPGNHNIYMGVFEFPREFACKCGCGKCDIDFEVWLSCQLIRQHFNVPVKINRACSCDAHNQAVGGAPGSDHRFGWAADVAVPGMSSILVAEFLETVASMHVHLLSALCVSVVQRIGIYEPGGLNGEDGCVHIGVRDRGPGSWKRWRFDAQRNLIEAR